MHKRRSGLATTVVLAALSAFFLLAGSAPSVANPVTPAGQAAARAPAGVHGNIQVREHVACHHRSATTTDPTPCGGAQVTATPTTLVALPTLTDADALVTDTDSPTTAPVSIVRGRAPPA